MSKFCQAKMLDNAKTAAKITHHAEANIPNR